MFLHRHFPYTRRTRKCKQKEAGRRTNHYQLEFDSYLLMIHGKRIPFRNLFILFCNSLFNFVEMLIRYIPGGIGYKLRYFFYKPFLAKLGHGVLIDTGVFLNGLKNISIGDYTWIDASCRLEAMMGPIAIGRRVHIAPFSLIFARDPVYIEDYVGISSFSRIYSSTEYPYDAKRMSGPMVPPEMRATRHSAITLHRDSFLGTGAVLLPGAELNEGAVVGANTVISKPVGCYKIVAGSPAREIGDRDPVKQVNI